MHVHLHQKVTCREPHLQLPFVNLEGQRRDRVNSRRTRPAWRTCMEARRHALLRKHAAASRSFRRPRRRVAKTRALSSPAVDLAPRPWRAPGPDRAGQHAASLRAAAREAGAGDKRGAISHRPGQRTCRFVRDKWAPVSRRALRRAPRRPSQASGTLLGARL